MNDLAVPPVYTPSTSMYAMGQSSSQSNPERKFS